MKRMLILGGAGFIGTNAALWFAARDWEITIFDNLSRKGTPQNLAIIEKEIPHLRFIGADIKDSGALETAVTGQDAILHLAAQVAVTTSLTNPRLDFETNVLGTFNVLEAIRQVNPKAIMLFASTNKVYGELNNRNQPVSETQALDFHSPYGCSKGSGDQYALDYARCFGIRTAVLRQSCIYGPHQLGTSDQGWVAHFIQSILSGKRITIYGSGLQVRDILYIDDLMQLYQRVIERIESVKGNAYNVGGGISNSISLLELITYLRDDLHLPVKLDYGERREGDQDYYISDISKAGEMLDWQPSIGCKEGVRKLVGWMERGMSIAA